MRDEVSSDGLIETLFLFRGLYDEFRCNWQLNEVQEDCKNKCQRVACSRQYYDRLDLVGSFECVFSSLYVFRVLDQWR
jgi:hypothetical protein